MRLAGSASVGRFHGNKKRPPTARQRRIEGLTTRRGDLLMADLNLMDRGVLANAHDRSDEIAARRNDG